MADILNEIDQSRVCIMDLTDQRHNVYFEAGIVLGKGIDLVLSCHENEKDILPFDATQYDIIFWDEHKISNFIKKIDIKLKVNLRL